MDNIVLSPIIENTLYSHFMVYDNFTFNTYTVAGTYCMNGPQESVD